MNMKKFQQIMSYVLVALLSAALSISVVLGLSGKKEQSKLDALEELILDRFIGDADKIFIEDAAADAMVNALGDRWSYYVPADRVAALTEQKNNAYVGIGVTITVNEDQTGLLITQVAAGGSAEEAGFLVGDVIVAVAGKSVAGQSLDEIKNQIRGEENTQVEITVERGGKQITAMVTRKQIKTAVATGKMLQDKIGLVRIVNFNDKCKTETIAAIEQLLAEGAEKLIFDVRFNGGGAASEMVGVLDYLLPEGPLFRTEDYAGKETVETSDEKCLELPMAVLVNGESYSAAEFFAAALREYEAAIVIGEQTTGKGYFQYTYMLPDGSAVGLSTGKYYTPNGVSLAQKGIMPDVMVPVDAETANAIYAGTLVPEADPQIQAAVKALAEK
ncbi:MAG: PDZ domain-containing protein [Oscillospiraceae bacterium]|nr:PDZ domain-containing protein [Oscillospiraceae bacterium]